MAKSFDETKVGFGLMNVIAIVIIIGLVGLGGHFLGKYEQNKSESKTQKVEAVQTIAYDGAEGRSALDLLKEKAEIQTQDSSLGAFVTTINGTANSEDHFWMFYVNGELAPTAADQFITKDGDKIEWRYEKFQ